MGPLCKTASNAQRAHCALAGVIPCPPFVIRQAARLRRFEIERSLDCNGFSSGDVGDPLNRDEKIALRAKDRRLFFQI